MSTGALGLALGLGFVGSVLVVGLIRNRLVMIEDRTRRARLSLPGNSLLITGISGSQTDAVLTRMAASSHTGRVKTGTRFTVVVDDADMTLWRGGETPRTIARFPLTTIHDVTTGVTGFGNTNFPTLFVGVQVGDRVYDLQLRVANAKGLWNASMTERDRYAAEILKRVNAAEAQ